MVDRLERPRHLKMLSHAQGIRLYCDGVHHVHMAEDATNACAPKAIVVCDCPKPVKA